MRCWCRIGPGEVTWCRLRYLSTYNKPPSQREVTLNIAQLEDTGLTQKVKRLESKGLPVVHHHGYVCELPIKHRFAMKKFHGVLRYLRKDDVISAKQIVEPNLLDPEVFKVVHDDKYIDRFIAGETTEEEQRKTGFKWSEGIVSRVRYETAGTLLSAKLAMERGIACSTGGGTHHAFPDHGSGYCLVNDLAVAAMTMFLSGCVHRVVVVDLDVHQIVANENRKKYCKNKLLTKLHENLYPTNISTFTGDGTAYIFTDNTNIFTFSMHNEMNFPFMKQESDVDIGLPDKVKDKEYMNILKEILPWILDYVRPDLVLYDAGVDPHEKDELGRLNLSDQGLFDRDFYVIDTCHSQGIPVATVIGGGYQRDINALSVRHTIVHRAATKVWNKAVLYPT